MKERRGLLQYIEWIRVSREDQRQSLKTAFRNYSQLLFTPTDYTGRGHASPLYHKQVSSATRKAASTPSIMLPQPNLESCWSYQQPFHPAPATWMLLACLLLTLHIGGSSTHMAMPHRQSTGPVSSSPYRRKGLGHTLL